MSINWNEPHRETAEKVKTLFLNETGYAFEKTVGNGAFGVTLCYRNKNAGPSDYETIAIKAIGVTYQNIQIEIDSLKPFLWAEHILTIIEIPLQSEDTTWIKKNTIITEYIEHGTLSGFHRRLAEHINSERKLPNRILWAMFLCLVRGCVGMAYPPGDPEKAPKGPRDRILETIPANANDYPPEKCLHSDLHGGNIMLGSLGQGEHRIFPVLKLIDFGLATIAANSIEENIFAVGETMCNLICEGGHLNIYRLLNDKQGPNTMDPDLDSELLALIIQCVNFNAAMRPSLSHLLSAITPKIQQTYPNIPEESDVYISDLVQRHILDAA